MSPLLTLVSGVNEGLALVNAFMPLLRRQLSGGAPVTEAEVVAAKEAALATMDADMKKLDEEIERQGG